MERGIKRKVVRWGGETTDEEGLKVEEAEAHPIMSKARAFWKEHFAKVSIKSSD